MILLIALLIWRLIERSMRIYLEKKAIAVAGRVYRQTKRPTSFMMSTNFHTIIVVRSGKSSQLARPLKPVQLEYLHALDVDPQLFVLP
jgi:hypothetical protein